MDVQNLHSSRSMRGSTQRQRIHNLILEQSSTGTGTGRVLVLPFLHRLVRCIPIKPQIHLTRVPRWLTGAHRTEAPIFYTDL